MSERIILASLDRVPARDVGVSAFGLNLSVAMSPTSDGGAAVSSSHRRRFLQPWSWKPITQIGLAWFIPGHGGLVTQRVELDASPPQLARERIGHSALSALRARLDARYDSFLQGTDDPALFNQRFGWIPEPEADQQPWPAFVGELSLQPWPFPQSLNLSFLFERRLPPKVDAAVRAGGSIWLVAAPYLPCDALGDDSPELRPEFCFDAGSDPRRNPRMEIAYMTSGSEPHPVPAVVRALAREYDTPTSASPTFLDLGTQWVGRAPNGAPDLFGDDWLARVEERLSAALDLLPTFLDWMLEDVDEPWVRERNAEDLRRAAFSLTRDVLGLGLDLAPDDGSLVERLLFEQSLAEGRANAAAKDPGAAWRQTDPLTLEAWLGLLRRHAELEALGKLLIAAEEARSTTAMVRLLRQLYETAIQPEHLRNLFRVQWTATSTEPPSAFGDEALLAKVDLRRQLRMENLGRYWQRLVAGFDNEADLGRARSSLAGQLYEYFEHRLGRGQPGTWPIPAWNEITLGAADPGSCLAQRLRGYCDRVARDVVPSTSMSAPEPEETPRGITLQIDSLKRLDGTDEDGDLVNRIQGVGVLMRQSDRGGDGVWRCLHWVAGRVADGVAPTDSLLRPSRISYRNGLRSVTVTYNNEPCTVLGPLAKAAEQCVTVLCGEANGAEIASEPDTPTEMIRFEASPSQRIPCLKFGAEYEFLPFIVANCGALPRELAPDQPFEPRLDAFEATELVDRIRRVVYQRKVPVGAVRYLADAEAERIRAELETAEPGCLLSVPKTSADRALKLPPIREKVTPWAREDWVRTIAPELADSGEAPRPAAPLLLLAPAPGWGAPDRFAFGIRCPAADIHTWDRWVAGRPSSAEDPDSKRLRQRAWESYFKCCAENLTRSQDQQLEHSLDDPAVHGIGIELFELDPRRGRTRVDEPCPGDLEGGAATVRRSLATLPWRVELTVLSQDARDSDARDHNASTPLKCDSAARTVTIRLRPGRVYQLRISSRIDAASYRDRFADILAEKVELDGELWVTPTSFLVEVADELIRDDDAQTRHYAEQLWRHLKPEFSPPEDAGALRVTLDLDTADEHLRRQIHRADVLWQTWTWHGRNVRLHPDLTRSAPEDPLDPEAELERYLRWEIQEFGERPDHNHLALPMARGPGSAADEPPAARFVFREPLEGESASHDPRARHHRFAVKAFSRYEGMLPDGSVTHVESRGSRMSTRWRSLFVPCRWHDPVAVPRVKLVLPLTENILDEGSAPAGLLVVLDEPWFEHGGLAERIRFEIELTSDPELDEGACGEGNRPPVIVPRACSDSENSSAIDPSGLRYFEFGPDPILEGKAAPLPAGPARFRVELGDDATWIRSIGHTFDSPDAEGPRFVSTSFVVPPPRLLCGGQGGGAEQGSEEDFAWWFCKLRARRELVLGSTRERAPKDLDRVLSAPSNPFWTQFLPPFSLTSKDHFDHAPRGIERLGEKRLSLRNADGRKVHWRPGRPTFEPYLVVTRRVFDATGKSNQVAYVGVFYRTSEDLWMTGDAISIEAGEELEGRIIEIQRRGAGTAPLTTGRELWKAIFDDSTAASGRARIVRISEPFSSQPIVRPKGDA